MDSLSADPKRQAIPTLNGFSYQIWQSVLRWLSLREDEVIFLEGAEDIDILGPGHAETVQVKETSESGPVTLRTRDVLDAIAHFWQHSRANPDIAITFRFLTTAERGHEHPNPFGSVRDLDLWDSCKYPGKDVRLLKDFLAAQEILPQDLRAFIVWSLKCPYHHWLAQ